MHDEREWIRSYAEAWDDSIRVHFKNRFISITVSFSDCIFFIILEGFMLLLDKGLGLAFAPLVHYLVIPGVIVYLLRKAKPEGKPIHQWLLSLVKYLLSDKHVGGNLEPVELSKSRLRVLSRKAK